MPIIQKFVIFLPHLQKFEKKNEIENLKTQALFKVDFNHSSFYLNGVMIKFITYINI